MIDIGETVGHEQRELRPWLVVTRRSWSPATKLVHIIPLTTKTEKVEGHPYRIILDPSEMRPLGNAQPMVPSLALTDQVRAASSERFTTPARAQVIPVAMQRVLLGLKYVFDIK